LSFPLGGNLSEPLFGKEGQGEILWRIDSFKKNSLLSPKGERFKERFWPIQNDELSIS
jgi:hypothetical protein